MRISDWSSDVCSSDLIDLAVKEGQTLGVVGESGSGKTTLGLALLRLVSSKGPIVYLGDRIDGFDSKRMRPLRRHMQIVFKEIGRASCRERVCQYVYISVVAVSLKKKTKIK